MVQSGSFNDFDKWFDCIVQSCSFNPSHSISTKYFTSFRMEQSFTSNKKYFRQKKKTIDQRSVKSWDYNVGHEDISVKCMVRGCLMDSELLDWDVVSKRSGSSIGISDR